MKNSNTFVNAFINLVATPKNSSPTSARLARNPSIALLYFPDADSVTSVNSRPAMFANCSALAPINSITCSVWLPDFPKLLNSAAILAN